MLVVWKQFAVALGALVGTLALYAYGVRFERRVIAGLALRGEGRWGFLWPLVDAGRTLVRRTSLPPGAVRWACRLAPLLTFAWGVAGLACIPRGPAAQDLAHFGALAIPWPEMGLLWAILFGLGGLLGTALFAWAIRRAPVARQGIDTVLQGARFQLPIWLAVAGAVALAGSLDLRQIVEAQSRALPYVVYQPLAVWAVGLSLCAGGRRLPLSFGPLGDALGDYHLQHAGWVYGLFHLGEYVHLLLGSALVATLYLGGWWAPWYPGFHWVLIKSVAVAGALLGIRHHWRDRLQGAAGERIWRQAVWLALGNLALGVALMAWRGG